MKINSSVSEKMILEELGIRIKQYRITMNITQNELAEKSGVSASTITRIENGEDTKMSNYIRILIALNLVDNMDILIPELQPDFKSLFEKKPQKQRVRTNSNKETTKWIWKEDE